MVYKCDLFIEVDCKDTFTYAIEYCATGVPGVNALSHDGYEPVSLGSKFLRSLGMHFFIGVDFFKLYHIFRNII